MSVFVCETCWCGWDAEDDYVIETNDGWICLGCLGGDEWEEGEEYEGEEYTGPGFCTSPKCLREKDEVKGVESSAGWFCSAKHRKAYLKAHAEFEARMEEVGFDAAWEEYYAKFDYA